MWQLRDLNRIVKYGIPAVAWGMLGALLIFMATHYYRLKDTLDLAYIADHNVRDWGLSRIRGNTTSLNDKAMLAVFVLGIVLSLALFVLAGRKHMMRWPILLIVFGAVVPMLPPYDENILARLLVSVGLLFFGGLAAYVSNYEYHAQAPTPSAAANHV